MLDKVRFVVIRFCSFRLVVSSRCWLCWLMRCLVGRVSSRVGRNCVRLIRLSF